MIREEAIEILKYNSNVIHQTINGETDPKEVEALDVAIKALEQEILLFKSGFLKDCEYCEAKQRDVFNKVKAEIEALPKTYPFVNHIDMYVKVSDVVKIIDKYKAESEE